MYVLSAIPKRKLYISWLVGQTVSMTPEFFASTRIYQIQHSILGPGQYLLGDAAYTHTKYMVPPHNAPEANQNENQKNSRFLLETPYYRDPRSRPD